MTLTGNLADAPVVTAGFGVDGVASQPAPPLLVTGAFGSPTAPRRHVHLRHAGYVDRHRDRTFNVAVTGVTP